MPKTNIFGEKALFQFNRKKCGIQPKLGIGFLDRLRLVETHGTNS